MSPRSIYRSFETGGTVRLPMLAVVPEDAIIVDWARAPGSPK